MKVLQNFETFQKVKGVVQFHRVTYIVEEEDGKWFMGYSQNRRKLPIDLSELEDTTELQHEGRTPKILPHWTIVAPNNHNYFVKRPQPMDYLDEDMEGRIKAEIEVCEIIKRSPHPGLAVYHGCMEAMGRSSGLCFKQYKDSLKQRVNPGSLNKHHFIENGRPLVTDIMREWLEPIRGALRHLHTLGLVHNDIAPGNIMLDNDDRPVIIDFDSASAIGTSLKGVKRTYP